MENYYSSAARFPVGVDCIIFGLVGGSLCLLLTRRAFEPAKGEWSLMGGFVDADESVDDAARRILRQLTGLENIYMEQVGAFGWYPWHTSLSSVLPSMIPNALKPTRPNGSIWQNCRIYASTTRA